MHEPPPCEHLLLRRQIPRPPAGTPCPICGEVLEPPESAHVNGCEVELDERTFEDLRAIARLTALNVAYRDPDVDGTLGAEEWSRSRRRIVEDRGWTDEYTPAELQLAAAILEGWEEAGEHRDWTEDDRERRARLKAAAILRGEEMPGDY